MLFAVNFRKHSKINNHSKTSKLILEIITRASGEKIKTLALRIE